MTSRHPTAEEKRLWHESNRFTKKKAVAGDSELRTGEDDATLFAAVLVDPAFSQEKVKPISRSPGKPKLGTNTPTSPAATTALKPLPTREARRMMATSIEATLDLHGCSKRDAYVEVRAFIARQYRAGRRHVLIITGKGRGGDGVLRRELPHWLNEPPIRAHVAAFAASPVEKGGTGATHVLLKANRD